ncbi:hypothetical protein D3C80_1809630 [compost metagenome]
MPFAHQAVGRQRWQAVLDTQALALSVAGGCGRRLVQQALLYLAQSGQQAQVIRQRVALGQ